MGSRISLHLRPARDFDQVVAAKLRTMKLLFPSLLLFLGVLGAFADPPMPAEGEDGSHSPPYYALANYLQQQKRAQASALERELLAEYLANQMGSPDYPEPEVGRGKRSAFIPPMGAIVDDHNPLTGPSDYSDVAELVPDHKAAPVVHNVHQ